MNNYSKLVTGLVVAAFALLGSAGLASAQAEDGEALNVDTGATSTSIQAVIDMSSTTDNHTIEVGDGTYSEVVNIDKDITLQAKNSRNAIIAGDVNIESGGVIFSGFVVNAGASNGIVFGEPSGDNDDVEISDNEVNSTNLAIYIDVPGSDNYTGSVFVSGNDINGARKAIGVGSEMENPVTITGNTIENSTDTDVEIFSEAVINQNNFLSNVTAIVNGSDFDIDAEENFFGTEGQGPQDDDVENSGDGSVDTDPFLCDEAPGGESSNEDGECLDENDENGNNDTNDNGELDCLEDGDTDGCEFDEDNPQAPTGEQCEAATLVDAFMVSGANGSKTVSGLSTSSNYFISVAGVYNYGSADQESDAEYISNDAFAPNSEEDPTNPNGPDANDLSINGISTQPDVDFGAYNADHEYSTSTMFASTTAEFFIVDGGDTDDNEGSLNVAVYECSEDSTSPDGEDEASNPSSGGGGGGGGRLESSGGGGGDVAGAQDDNSDSDNDGSGGEVLGDSDEAPSNEELQEMIDQARAALIALLEQIQGQVAGDQTGFPNTGDGSLSNYSLSSQILN